MHNVTLQNSLSTQWFAKQAQDIPEALEDVLRLTVMGGASGVGKTALLDLFPQVARINTGVLFREQMMLSSPDDVRKTEWPEHEAEVAQSLSTQIVSAFIRKNSVVVDTHFAARHHHGYRIGIRRPLTFSIAKDVFAYADKARRKCLVNVVLIHCDPYALLQRRRLDKTRDRELIPSDCFNGLRQNAACSREYFSEFLRAQRHCAGVLKHVVRYCLVENQEIEAARTNLRTLLERR